MAHYEENESFRIVNATSLDGIKTPVEIRYSENVLAAQRRPKYATKKKALAIIDVTGAKDGAGSVVKTAWLRVITPDERETIRVRETPSELAMIFQKAGFEIPETRKSLGRMARDVMKAMNIY